MDCFNDEIIEFKDLKVYSDLFWSNNLFLFCVNIFILVHDLNIIVKALTFREIFVSPNGRLIDFFPWMLRFASSDFSWVGT